MENISESLNTHTLDKNRNHPLEIPLTSCSNLHLFKQLQIFLQQNNIPIEITTSISISIPTQTGGGDSEKEKEKEKEKSLVYQSEYSPFTIFQSFMDRFFLQKQHENIEDTKNKQLLDSIFSKDKSKKEIIHSLQTLSNKYSRDETESKEEKEPEPEPSKEKEKEPKKKITTIDDTKTLYMHIKTNHTNPIESIRGTKLYYLYQRQQNAQCAQFV
jgi:hypothetical protein